MADRLDHDPNLDACPDFASNHYEAMRALMRNNGSTNEQAIEALTQAWTLQNEELRERWAQQVEQDQQEAEAQAAQAAAQGNGEQGNEPPADPVQAVEPELANENLEKDKKAKMKLRSFNPQRSVASVLAPRPSTYAINKVANFEYVELWYFTKEGCKEAQSTQRTETDDSFGMSRVGDLVAFRPVASVQASKRALQDADLSWEQFHYANRSFLKNIDSAGWPPEHVQALLQFFINLKSSPFLDRDHGKQIVLTYQARVRCNWMDVMKDGNEEVFNIALVSSPLMESISNEIQSSATAEMQRQ
ncbi:hypothetical protein BJ912DRAFT_886588 [Pholiota molesta]|nr:hypothetical protein BJ912DRAFT_886588 [Pholiota molesta]